MRCSSCRGHLDSASIDATRAELGPWQIRNERRPFLPACSTQRLRDLVARGVVRGDTPVRRAGGLWDTAARTPGVAPFLHLCPACHARVSEAMDVCPLCEADLWHEAGEAAPLASRRPRRSTAPVVGAAIATLTLIAALLGGGFALGRMYQMHRPPTSPPPTSIASADEPEAPPPPTPVPRNDPPASADAPAPSPPEPVEVDPIIDALAGAVAEGDLDRAAALVETAAARTPPPPDLAAWADLIRRERERRGVRTLP